MSLNNTPLWASERIAEAVKGKSIGDHFNANGICIDSRNIRPGDLFVALVAERDGHDFVQHALHAGAAGVLVDRFVDAPSVQVADTEKALSALATAARVRATRTVRVAVTGSVGKTSVTQALAKVCEQSGEPTHRPQKSFNNHIGVPVTLARMPMETQYGVFELGMNHAGEIRALTSLVQPHIAIITAVGAVHTENFPDGEQGVANAKAEIFEGLIKGGIAILNHDGGWFKHLAESARVNGAKLLTFGTNPAATLQLLDFQADGDGASMTIHFDGERRKMKLAQSARHWADNAMAITLAARAMGIDFEHIEKTLAVLGPVEGRGDQYELVFRGHPITVIDDSYNANPISMTAALKNLGQQNAKGRRIAILTDMLELGRDQKSAHVALRGQLIRANVDLVFAAGARMGDLFNALPRRMQGAWREKATALTHVLENDLQSDDIVLVKGSNGSGAHRIANWMLNAED